MTHLFQTGAAVGASGITLPWKIECDAFSQEDYYQIAEIVAPHLPSFNSVVGVPPRVDGAGKQNNGMLLARAFRCHVRALVHDPLLTLIVDDVWTTGGSVRSIVETLRLAPSSYCCFVVFARTRDLPQWVWPFWRPGMVKLDIDSNVNMRERT